MENLNINAKSYKLPKKNYHSVSHKKRQIVIGNTFNNGMLHYNGWLNRHNGGYKKTAAFTIDKSGNIYQHFDPKYFSNFLLGDNACKQAISIVLENEGWLTKDSNGEYKDWVGNKYDGDVYETIWRKHEYWVPYTKEQMESLANLTKFLCKKFRIPLRGISHNTKVNDIYDYNGVVFRSNYSKDSTDVTPAFNYIYFLKKLNDE